MSGTPSAVDLAAYCADRLNSRDFHDYSLNGLQYEGCRQITTVCAAVDATMEAVEAAAEEGAEALLVHHGLFWGKSPVPLTGRVGEIVRALVKNDISLLAYHLPLDAHNEIGNNRLLANDLSLTGTVRFGLEGRSYLGVAGALPQPQSPDDLAQTLGDAWNCTSPRVYGYGPELISRVAICSGRGATEEWLSEALELGCQAYLTGEVVYEELLAAQHLGINIITAGHYQTERCGVQALGQELSLKFGLNYRFLELSGGVKAW